MIRILGPLVVLDKRDVPLQLAPKPRRVLAVLVTHPNQLVPLSALTRELWDDPPRSATTAVQTYVGQLRRVLAAAFDMDLTMVAERVLVTDTGGYGLHVSPSALDVLEYVEIGNRGKAAIRDGDDEEGVRLLEQALGMWRGPALANVESGPILRAQIDRMEECRLCCREYRIIAELRRGGHRGLISELVELTAAHPLHENLHGHLMLALYRSGRRSEALIAFQCLRTRLSDELGLDPTPALMELHQAILVSDVSLSHPDSGLMPRLNAA